MKDQTHLFIRGTTYWFRCRVPAALVREYGKKEITFSLRTKDKKEALAKAKLEDLRLSQEFSHKLAQPEQELSQVEIDSLSALYLSQLLEEDEAFRNEGLSDREYTSLSEAYEIVGDEQKGRLARGRPDLDDFEVADFLESHGIKLAKDAAQYRAVSMALLKGSVRATEMMQARHKGEVVETPTSAPVIIRGPARAPSEDTLEALRDYWLTQPAKKGGQKTRTAIAEANTVIRKFKEMVGDIPPSRIEKRHVVLLKDKMLEAGSSRQCNFLSVNLPRRCHRDFEIRHAS